MPMSTVALRSLPALKRGFFFHFCCNQQKRNRSGQFSSRKNSNNNNKKSHVSLTLQLKSFNSNPWSQLLLDLKPQKCLRVNFYFPSILQSLLLCGNFRPNGRMFLPHKLERLVWHHHLLGDSNVSKHHLNYLTAMV